MRYFYGLTKLTLAAAISFTIVPAASASNTLQFTESSKAGSYSFGNFGTISRPVTFNFTIPDALLPNHGYNFGKENVESGDSGNVSDFTIADGTPNSLFKFSDASFKEYFNGNNIATFSRIHFEMDENAAIVNYDIPIGGRSHADRNQFLQYHLQDYYYDRYGPSITGITLNISSGLVQTGGLQCITLCTATFKPIDGGGGVGAVPEPAVWATMLTGFGLAGSTLRRRRNAQTACA